MVTIDKGTCFIVEYIVHSHKFGIGIPTGNEKLNILSSNELQKEQTRSQNLKTIFIDEYSMLRYKELFRISERLKQIECNNLFFGGVYILLMEILYNYILYRQNFCGLKVYQA